MLPYLIAGAIGAGVAMLDKDKKKSRNKYAEGGEVSGSEILRKYNEVTEQGGYMNCELFCILMKDGKSFKKFDKLRYEGIDKLQEGDVLQFGDIDNPRHYAIYLQGDKVLEVEEWGASPSENTLSDNLNMYEEISAVYREPNTRLAQGGRVSTYDYVVGGNPQKPFDVLGRKDGMIMYHTSQETIKYAVDKAEELLENGYDEVLIAQPD